MARREKQEYQLALRNEQTCHAFEEMLCAVIDGCNTDTLCDMFNGMIENVISPLFQQGNIFRSKERTLKIIFPLTPGMIKNVNP